ncbi:hypothetical protein K2X33_02310 [bacterium]|nr:hypothetical protein [bacterium]
MTKHSINATPNGGLKKDGNVIRNCHIALVFALALRTLEAAPAPAIDPDFEFYEGGSAAAEAELRSKVIDKFRLIQAGIQAQTGKMLRDTHTTGVCLAGKFEFYERTEDFLKAGTFGKARTISVPHMRFADANSGVQSNRVPDVRAVSFWLDLDGQRQDFSMNNDPIFTFGSQTDFDNFLAFSIMLKQIKASGASKAKVAEEVAKLLAANSKLKAKFDHLKDEVVLLTGKETHHRPTGGDLVHSVAKTLAIGKSQQNKDVFSYITENYGSGAAFKFGKGHAAKFLLVRCADAPTTKGPSACESPAPVRQKAPKDAPEDFLVRRLKDTVNQKTDEFCFELKVQILDAETMRDNFGKKHTAQEWVEDATLNWNGPALKKLDKLGLFADHSAKCYSLGRLTAVANSFKSATECDDPKNAFDVNTHSHADLKPLGNINRARRYAERQSAQLRRHSPNVTPAPVSAVQKTQAIEQGWDNTARDEFWYTPQGSFVIPYKWFLALKDAETGRPVKDVLEKDGLIPMPKSALNPDALPIGLTIEPEPKAGFAALQGKGDWLGVTCAACHVGAVSLNGTRYVLDGAPSKADIQSFSMRLEKALDKTLASDSAFKSFTQDLAAKPTQAQVKEVRERLAARNTRSFFHGVNREKGLINAGPGRTDAFAVILNEVASRALGQPGNAHEGTAPVSFPKLWGAPFLKWVQYSGLSNNAFTRNTGEVLGVFGDVNLDPASEHFLQTTARLANLQKLEEHMRNLQPPKYESVFGAFTADQKKSIARGSEVFHKVANCYKCHGDEQPHTLGKFQNVTLLPAGEFQPDYTRNRVFAGTDPLYFINLKKNWLAVNPGSLKGTSVIGAFLKKNPEVLTKLRFADDKVVNGKVQRGPFGKSFLASLTGEKAFGESANAVQMLAQVTLAIGLKYMVDNDIKMDANDPVYQKLTGGAVPGTQPTAGVFKTGPLTGVWATAPYLHNGSVRTLRDMLVPAAEREAAFYIGGDDYDQKNGGFVSSGSHLFFANRMGDTNSGHFAFSGAASLTDDQKDDLLMYLKSL